MMGSRVCSERKPSSESSLQECQTLPQSPFKLNARKNKSSSKSRVSSKRLKTEHEVTQPSKNREKSEDNLVEEKENTLRRSKRRKICNSNVELEKTAPIDVKYNLKNDVKEIEDENLRQNLSFNFIPANVKKNLDKELFSEESDEEQNLNIKCPEAIVKEKQLVVSLKGIKEAVKIDNTVEQAGNLDDNKTAIRKADCGTRSMPNSLQLFGEIIADNENNENEINTEEEEIEENGTRDMTNEVLLNTEDKGKYERINNAKLVINDETISDPSLDLLYVDIKKADNIINSLKPMDVETNCSVRKQTIHAPNSKPRLSGNDSMVDTLYAKKDKNVADINARKNLDALSQNSFESEASTSSKNCQMLTHGQQENSLENMNYMKTELNETIDDISSYNDNLAAKQEYNGVKYHSLRNKDSNDFDASSSIAENQKKISETWHEYDSLAMFNNQTLSKRELNEFLMENGNSHEKNDLDNSQSSKKLVKKFHIEVNDRKNITDDIEISVEGLEVKRNKLTLHYMSALDYEKENKENGLEMKKKGSDTENGNFDTDAEDESIANNSTFITQKFTEMSKKDLDNLPKEIDCKDMKNRSELHIHQHLNSNGILDEKEHLKEDTQQNSEEMKKGMHDSQKASQVTYDTTSNEEHCSKDQRPIKCDLTCYKETNKMYDRQEHFTTMQDHSNNIFSSQTLSNASSINEPNIAEVSDAKNEETEKWYKTKCIREAEATFIVTATGCFKSEHNENSTEMVNDRKEENTENLKEDLPSNEDIDGSFDMDDDFNLTASQMNMIDMDENNLYKTPNESKPCMKSENCNDTHFGQDSITVEIIDQLCYIRESVDSIKELLNTFMMKNDDKK